MSARQSEQPSQRYERLYRELRYRFFHSCLSVSRLIATPPPPAISSMALNVPPPSNQRIISFPLHRFDPNDFRREDRSFPRDYVSFIFFFRFLSFFLSSQRSTSEKKNIDSPKLFHVVATSKSFKVFFPPFNFPGCGKVENFIRAGRILGRSDFVPGRSRPLQWALGSLGERLMHKA